MVSGKWRPFCLGLNVLTHWPVIRKCLCDIMVNNDSGNDLVPNGPKPLPESILINLQHDPKDLYKLV